MFYVTNLMHFISNKYSHQMLYLDHYSSQLTNGWKVSQQLRLNSKNILVNFFAAMKLIAHGAEAKIYELEDSVIKIRLSKPYRIPEIDTKIIQQRIRKEAKMLQRVQALGIPSPCFIKMEGNELHMKKVNGTSLRDHLTEKNYEDVLSKVGIIIARLHNADIIHGDLTTLNFIVGDDIYVLDFGLSYMSRKDEDKAVDLYVFERALKCKHSADYLEAFYKGYSLEGSVSVLERLKLVRQRGRKREEFAIG